jgi:hypothetical protein
MLLEDLNNKKAILIHEIKAFSGSHNQIGNFLYPDFAIDLTLHTATMADTPNVPLPLNPKEQPILDNLFAIRTELTLLKQDRSSYVKSSDVIPLYESTIKQVELLSDIRGTQQEGENRGKQCSSRVPVSVSESLSYSQQLIEY